MNITEPQIAEYIEKTTPPPDEIIQEMAAWAVKRNFPYIGPQCGRLLYVLVTMTAAKRVFEIGSGFGYSLYWMAKGTPDDVELIGSDFDEENVNAAADFFKRGGIDHKAEVRYGDGIEIFKSTAGQFDIIVNDADKNQYPEIFKLAAPRLKVGGLFISDNVLWSGEVIEKTSDPETQAIQEHNQLIFSDPRFFSLILPIRDGLSLSIRQS